MSEWVVKCLELSDPAGTRGACQLRGWAGEFRRAAGSQHDQAVPPCVAFFLQYGASLLKLSGKRCLDCFRFMVARDNFEGKVRQCLVPGRELSSPSARLDLREFCGSGERETTLSEQ